MNITIIGAGNIGGGLGRIWTEKGHNIFFGARNPSSDKTKKMLTTLGDTAKVMFIKDAAAQSDVIVLATPWEAVPEVVFQIVDMQNKILID